MATAPKPGGYNDMDALRTARRATADASTTLERALDEVARMREHVGRPDYGRLERRLGELALQMAKTTTALEGMWTIRSGSQRDPRRTELEALEKRVAALEAERAQGVPRRNR